MFFKIGVLKNFAIFTEKNTCAPVSLFLMKLQASHKASTLFFDVSRFLQKMLYKQEKSEKWQNVLKFLVVV